ncbi:SEC14-like protein 5 [Hydra vulgaris]|uniref:SEC14-like protein 1 n=1 Tax=Hydra vulgaris TaxID=6087 RepID=T2M7V3_HYDVU|nr:SEC14-like protein 5 [Hydra vulgaris]
MVQEYTSPVRVYEFPFEMVMEAYEKRFPTCKMIPAFLGSDITYDYKSDDGAIHIVERRCRLNVDAPYLIRKMAGVDHAIFIQRNSLNRLNRTLKIEAWNESFSSRLIIKEHCYYSVHPNNPNWTLFEQDASLDVVSFFGFEVAVEKLAIKAYTSNLKKGKEIIMYYINELIAEGKTSFPLFQDSEGRPRSVSYLEKQNKDVARRDSNQETQAENGETKKVESNDNIDKPTKEIDADDLVEDEISKNPVNIEKVVDPPPVQEFKLDEAYIARYLGNLSMKEENHLMQLRRRFQVAHVGKMPSEAVMLRFLRARDVNLDKAFEMLKNSLHWRRTHHVDTILDTWKPPDQLLEYYPGGWHYNDKEGRPVYIVRLGTMDFKGLLKTVGEDGFVKHVVSINEEGLKKCREATEIYAKPITNWTLIIDLEGLSMRHLWRPGVRAVLRIIEVVQANYPETMSRLLIIRAPKVFVVLWTLLYPFIDENSRKKFLIYTGDDYQGPGGLEDYLMKEYIPNFLGGPCECHLPVGKVVPKSFYKFEPTGESNWMETDLYHTGQVVKGTPHEVIITVTEAECVITWDFDVIEGDCVFQLLRHKRPREATNLTSCLGDTSITKQSIRPGIDAQVVERPITCAQGDSLQGTHICQQAGVYILQWKYSNAITNVRQTVKAQNKSKIMYYYEVLPSKDYKGSMSSLSSNQSRFSQLSILTGTISNGMTNSSSASNSSC